MHVHALSLPHEAQGLPLRAGMPAGDVDDVREQRLQVQVLALERTLARVIEQLADEVVQALRFADDQVQEPRVLPLHLELALQHLDRSADRVQTVPDLVRDSRRELPDGRQRLAPADPLLQGPDLREILEETDHAAPPSVRIAEKARGDPQGHLRPVRLRDRDLGPARRRAVLQRVAHPDGELREAGAERVHVGPAPHRVHRAARDLRGRPVPVAHDAVCIHRHESARHVLQDALRVEERAVQLRARGFQRPTPLLNPPPQSAPDHPDHEEQRHVQQHSEQDRPVPEPLRHAVSHRGHEPLPGRQVEPGVRHRGSRREEHTASHREEDAPQERRQEVERHELALRSPREEHEVRGRADVHDELRGEQGLGIPAASQHAPVREPQHPHREQKEPERKLAIESQGSPGEHHRHHRDQHHGHSWRIRSFHP